MSTATRWVDLSCMRVARDIELTVTNVEVDINDPCTLEELASSGSDRTVIYLIGNAQSRNHAQSQLALRVGMGLATSVDARVVFVDGSVVTLSAVSAGATMDIRDRP